MKILITTDWYQPVINGVVTSVRVLSEELRKRGHEVRILTLSRTCRSHVENQVIYVGSAGAGCIYPEARFRLPVSGKYIRDLMEWGPDIIHSQCEFSTFFLARKIASERNIPIVHTYHTIYEDYTHYFSPRKTWGKEIVEKITRRLSCRVSSIIAPSEKILKILEGYGVACPVCVIPSGINLSAFAECRNAGWREKIRKKFGISHDTTVLVYMGRLAKEKNVEELIRYQKEAEKQGTVLMVVGDGPHRRYLEEKTEELKVQKSVIFTGSVSPEETGRYYQAGDLFVSASTSETQGMTYAEALACGLPLLCRKDGCLNGIVEDGKNGWQYRDMEEFLNFIKKWRDADEDEIFRMRCAAREAARRFSAGEFGRKVEMVYEQEMHRKSGAA